ncbi:MAG: LUD domain-containing protein [Desulfobacterales bacterium]|nr:MAG: LUD domain-containing protein [Desulfobacterales bacterium]
MLDKFREAAHPLGLKVYPHRDTEAVAAAIGALVRTKVPEWGQAKSVAAWRHPLIESLRLTEALAAQNVPVYFPEGPMGAPSACRFAKVDRQRWRERIFQSYIGITSADFGLAETATLVLRNRAGQARSVAIVPAIHVAVLEVSQLIADLQELYALLYSEAAHPREAVTNGMTLITGVSTTRDIGAVPVRPAHGPREVYVYVITGPHPKQGPS